jgi:cell division protein FtsI (penicillin-binding protein 3)
VSLKKDILWRVSIVYIAMLIFAVLIFGKILYIQLVEGNYWKEKANVVTLRDITIQPNRGDIFASGDKLLATSIPYYEVRMDLRATGLTDALFRQNIDSLSLRLSGLFRDKSSLAYKNELIRARNEGKRYHLIRRRVDYNQLSKLKDFPLFRLGQNKGGLIVIQDNQRIQPHGNLASRTIGYTTKDERGNVVGIEGAYDHVLRGEVGVRLMQRLSGNVWMPVNDGNEVEPRDGLDIVTTIDVDIQDVATKALMEQLQKHNALHGTAILMEVKTGDIKAMANLEKTSSGGYSESYNYAIGASTEPGSTFKLPALLVAIEHGHVKLTDTIDTGDGTITFFDQKITDTRKGGYGKVTVQESFEVSSNVAMAKIVDRYYKGKEKNFINKLYSMKLNEPLGIEIKGEANPEIKYPGDKLWSGVSLPMMSIGYEIRLTPLQILTFYNAIANDGKMVRPKFVSAVRQHGNVIQTFSTEVINNSVCSQSTVKKARQLLEGVVERGTAMNLKNANYKIAGKTGTAQIANTKLGYKSESRVSHQASFVGYFPAENPRYSCIVVVSSPSNNVYYGNLVAGPVFKEIADKVYATSLDMHEEINKVKSESNTLAPFSKSGSRDDLRAVFKMLNINTYDTSHETDWVSTTSRETLVELTGRKIIGNLVPNVVDMALNDAVYILENSGLKVDFRGRGTVRKQSILPGTRIRVGERISLELSIPN